MTYWRDRNRRDEGGADELRVVEKIFLAPPLDLEVGRETGIRGCHQFHQCCRGSGVILSVHQSNRSMMRTNMNCYMELESTNSTYHTIVI